MADRVPRSDREPMHKKLLNYIVDNNGCWIWQKTIGIRGYGVTYHGRVVTVHRESWKLHRGPIPPGMCVCHKCDVKVCINPDHLFIGTHQDNIADKIRKSRQRAGVGEKHAKAKLTEAEALRLRGMDFSKRGEMSREAKRLGLDFGTVSKAVSGKTWKHLNPKNEGL